MRESRAVLALQKEKETIEKNIQLVKQDCGHQLLSNTSTTITSKSERATYFGFKEENIKIRTDIESIRNLQVLINEADSSVNKARENENSLSKQWSFWFKTLGQMMYQHYTPVFESIFGEYYTKAQIQKNKLLEAEKNVTDVKKSMSTQGFFAKLFSHVKYVSTNNIAITYENRFNTLLEKGGEAAFEDEKFPSILEHDEIEEVVRRSYKSCLKLKEDISVQHEEVEKLLEKKESLEAQLQDYDVASHTEKRLQELRRKIDTNVKSQNEYAAKIAEKFIDEYVDENGTVLKDFPQEFGSTLNELADLRMTFVSLERRIKIQELLANITSAERELISNKKKINSNTKKIQSLSKQNAELSQRDTLLSAQKEEWSNLKVSLELAEATNVKHLRENS
ncbi:MAG: hypothetical protein BKP49_04205 [Treponema sp. CETP13]|nr:MAG: hypothetical protein BKP49_04205 [Treponema sp. CETP13]